MTNILAFIVTKNVIFFINSPKRELFSLENDLLKYTHFQKLLHHPKFTSFQNHILNAFRKLNYVPQLPSNFYQLEAVGSDLHFPK